MVATEASNNSGTIHARPMALAEVDDAGEIWFVTPKESDKVAEAMVESRALITGQTDRAYVSVSGQIDVMHDPQRVAALWKSEWNAWFPDETADHRAVVLMRVRPEIGEYWLQGGLKGIRYLFEATRAMLDVWVWLLRGCGDAFCLRIAGDFADFSLHSFRSDGTNRAGQRA